MNVMQRLVLCAAATLPALSAAQAADLPVKASPVEYVRVCSPYGAGFFFIPGTDTCIKLGGYLRVDTTFNGGIQGTPAWNGDIGERDRYGNNFVTRSRMLISVDTRTATEYGLVRTFAEARYQFSTLGNSTENPNSLATNLGNNNNLLDVPGGGFVSTKRISSSSSAASPSVSRPPPMPRRGRAFRATSPTTFWAVRTPTPA